MTMTTYTATFSVAHAWATETFDAKTPDEALHRAHETFAADPALLAWCSYDPDINTLENIEIVGADERTCANWQSDDVRLRLAARDVLDALQAASQALKAAPCFEVGQLGADSYAIAALCDRAIALAKGSAP
jgi:hypothetical protein